MGGIRLIFNSDGMRNVPINLKAYGAKASTAGAPVAKADRLTAYKDLPPRKHHRGTTLNHHRLKPCHYGDFVSPMTSKYLSVAYAMSHGEETNVIVAVPRR
tara:strand:+ start:401 stop:703 length:303 start_codon:yes stop_codon:yes gene_type:complete